MNRTVRTVALVVALAACNDEPASAEGDAGGLTSSSSGGDTSGATSTSGGADSTGTGSAASTTDGDATADTAGADTTTGAFPLPEACQEPEALIDVTVATTPDGPFVVDEAWLGLDACSKAPYVVLARLPTPRTGPGVELRLLLVADSGSAFEPGVYPVSLADENQVTGTIELLAPFSAQPGIPDPDASLHAQIEVHERGWDLSVEVDLIYCGAGDCFCPCR